MTVGQDVARILTRATFSPCGRYRYTLPRIANPSTADRLCLFVMLNPSTADDERNDPTVTRAITYSQAWGYDGLLVGNVYAWRSTDPRALRAAEDPVGAENDYYLGLMAAISSTIVCAWGNHCAPARAAAVRSLMSNFQPLHYLRLNKGGSPCHPLYLPANLRPQPWTASGIACA